MVSLLYMNMYFDGVLKLVSDGSFVNRETGETVKYFKHYFQGDNNTVFEVGSRENFAQYIDEPCEVQVEVTKNGKDWRLKLLSLTPTKGD